MGEAVLVNGFQESGAKRSVNLQPRIDDLLGERFNRRADPFVFFVSFAPFVVQNVFLPSLHSTDYWARSEMR